MCFTPQCVRYHFHQLFSYSQLKLLSVSLECFIVLSEFWGIPKKEKKERPLWTTTSAYLTTLYVSQDLFLQSYSKLNIPLTASLPLCWTGCRHSRKRSPAWPPRSKVCRGNRPLHAHLHLFVMPTGPTSTPSTHAYFWLACVYITSITSVLLRGKATASFVPKAAWDLFLYFQGLLGVGVNKSAGVSCGVIARATRTGQNAELNWNWPQHMEGGRWAREKREGGEYRSCVFSPVYTHTHTHILKQH